ncbi:MAG TPA: CBS domain-containing protein [Gemmatimonadales bacterium]|nr:CBS domain-containing protein [Gemmatimonadales bacterium]
MKARELMTSEPACCTPEQTLQQAAQLMRKHDCGCIPVVENTATNRLVGVVTDRDITCRCTAAGHTPDTAVRAAMSRDPKSCKPDDGVEIVERIMSAAQVRRVPVVDDHGRLVGIIAQADLARDGRAASDDDVGKVVEQISQPART